MLDADLMTEKATSYACGLYLPAGETHELNVSIGPGGSSFLLCGGIFLDDDSTNNLRYLGAFGTGGWGFYYRGGDFEILSDQAADFGRPAVISAPDAGASHLLLTLGLLPLILLRKFHHASATW